MNKQKGSKLRNALEDKNLSQAEFARIMGILPQKVTNWINRGVPHGRVIEVAAKLEVPLNTVSQSSINDQIELYERKKESDPKNSKEFIELYGGVIAGMSQSEQMKLVGKIEMLVDQLKAMREKKT